MLNGDSEIVGVDSADVNTACLHGFQKRQRKTPGLIQAGGDGVSGDRGL